jgi:hypothetical protein
MDRMTAGTFILARQIFNVMIRLWTLCDAGLEAGVPLWIAALIDLGWI